MYLLARITCVIILSMQFIATQFALRQQNFGSLPQYVTIFLMSLAELPSKQYVICMLLAVNRTFYTIRGQTDRQTDGQCKQELFVKAVV